MKPRHLIISIAGMALLSACSGQGTSSQSSYPGSSKAFPRQGGVQEVQPNPHVKVGTPYVINGKRYYPEYNPYYDKTGIASWYGPGFHGKLTANGEIFDQNDLTAAHPTLPMPSMVRVTNLHNNRSAIIRINDRGPFKDNRIIDLSKKAAQRLGVSGLAKVRVQFLQRETEEYMTALNEGRNFDMFAYNDRPPEAKIVETVRYDGEDNGHTAAPVMTVQSSEPEPLEVVQAPIEREEKLLPALQEYAQQEPAYRDEPGQPTPQIAAPAAGQSGEFTIQAGVFSSESNARRLAEKLSAIAKASLDSMQSAGKTLWRVRVGDFASKGDAQQVLASVKTEGNVPDARVVRR